MSRFEAGDIAHNLKSYREMVTRSHNLMVGEHYAFSILEELLVADSLQFCGYLMDDVHCFGTQSGLYSWDAALIERTYFSMCLLIGRKPMYYQQLEAERLLAFGGECVPKVEKTSVCLLCGVLAVPSVHDGVCHSANALSDRLSVKRIFEASLSQTHDDSSGSESEQVVESDGWVPEGFTNDVELVRACRSSDKAKAKLLSGNRSKILCLRCNVIVNPIGHKQRCEIVTESALPLYGRADIDRVAFAGDRLQQYHFSAIAKPHGVSNVGHAVTVLFTNSKQREFVVTSQYRLFIEEKWHLSDHSSDHSYGTALEYEYQVNWPGLRLSYQAWILDQLGKIKKNIPLISSVVECGLEVT